MIKMRVIKWWTIAILSIGWGAEQLSAEDLSRKFYFSNFDQAEKSSNYLRFDMKSTNVWILNNNFHGFVKDFAIDIRGLEKGSISKVHLSFDVLDRFRHSHTGYPRNGVGSASPNRFRIDLWLAR